MGALIKHGLGISPSSVVFNLTPCVHGTGGKDYVEFGVDFGASGNRAQLGVEGDIFAVRNICLDMSMWRLGGAAVPLYLVQLANVGAPK